MPITVQLVESKADMKKFIEFPYGLYADYPNWIPPLRNDEWENFSRDKSPAYETAEAAFYLALDGKKVVGRIAGIDSQAANDKFKTKNCRFGWFECIDNLDVARALLEKVEAWGRSRGLETLTGPQGFTDFDPQGLMIEGFDETPTIVGGYNFSYYQALYEKLGLTKDIDYHEFTVSIPEKDPVPERLLVLGQRIKERSRVKLIEYKRVKDLVRERGEEIFALIDETFEEIYGAVPLTPKQVQYFIKKYIGFVDPQLVKLAVDDNNKMVGFLLTMPSLSRAFQKARGNLLPFGWFHLLKGLKTHEVLDFYLAGIKKPYQGTGLDLLLVLEIAKTATKLGFKRTESNLELETNTKVQNLWKHYNPRKNRHRRIYIKAL